MKAVEQAPLIEQVFAADAVEESIAGDWEDVQVDLGLKDHRETPRTYSDFFGMQSSEQTKRSTFDPASIQIEPYVPSTASSLATPKTANRSGSKKKVKNKMAQASRKKNRRK